MGKKNNKAPKKEAVKVDAEKTVVLQDDEKTVVLQETAAKEAPKYVNPILGWGIILGEIVVAAAIAAAIILPLM